VRPQNFFNRSCCRFTAIFYNLGAPFGLSSEFYPDLRGSRSAEHCSAANSKDAQAAVASGLRPDSVIGRALLLQCPDIAPPTSTANACLTMDYPGQRMDMQSLGMDEARKTTLSIAA